MKIHFRCPPELSDILPRPFPAKHGLPDWLKAMQSTAHSPDLGEEIRTMKHCPPFIDAMGLGFIVPLVTDLHVDKGRFDWNWAPGPSTLGEYSRSPITFHFADQLAGSPIYDADVTAIKFTNYWTIETEPGYSLLVTHPVNREDLPFRTLSGLVDTDRYKDGCIQFLALWSSPEFSGTLSRGTPVAQCIPVPRDALEFEFGELVGDAARRFLEVQNAVGTTPGTYRKRFRAAKP